MTKARPAKIYQKMFISVFENHRTVCVYTGNIPNQSNLISARELAVYQVRQKNCFIYSAISSLNVMQFMCAMIYKVEIFHEINKIFQKEKLLMRFAAKWKKWQRATFLVANEGRNVSWLNTKKMHISLDFSDFVARKCILMASLLINLTDHNYNKF